MRDISELPGGTEQAKPATPKPRTTTRSKPENTTSSSQDQENKAAPRRRTPSRGNSSGNSTGTPVSSNPSPTETNKVTPTPPTRPAPAQQSNHPAPNRSNAAPNQRNSGPANGQRTGGMNPAYRNTNAPARTGGNGTIQPNGTARPAPNNRGGTGYTQQRPGNAPGQQQRPQPGGPGSQPHAPGQSNGPRPSSQRPAGQRPAGRPGGATQGGARPGGQGHGNGGRSSGARPGNSAPRSQERRTAPVKEKPTGPISLPPQIVVKDLADLLSVSPIEVIRDLINKHAIFASINQVVDYEKAALVAKDLGFEPSQSEFTIAPAVRSERGEKPQSANEAMIASRGDEQTVIIPPVVTIMGHVDHGKTSLLDTIRETKVAANEAGGITQHIGAYQVEVHGKKITFLDTPGHEAFTAMRARGAQSTHIAIIVVAADDGVMPQTREAIDHARAAKVPIIIALNKIDKANANPDRVKQQLAEIGVVIEEYGGDIVCVPVSARQGLGIDGLLEYILLVAEVQDIRANPHRLATGVIIEARLEKNSGATATVLVQQGTLKVGDAIVVGSIAGRVRAMLNDRGKRIQKAPPSTPVSIIGLPEVPQAGDRLEVMVDERTAKQRAQQEAERRREETMPLGQVSLDTLYMQMQEGKVKELNVVLKSDVQGSSEAIKNSLSKLGEEHMKVRLIREGIGNISETDVHLAGASGAIIIGFNVKADGAAQSEAQKEGVDIRYYNVIYKLIDDIQAALRGMLEPTYREVVDGHAEVMQIFKAGKTTVIAGCRITDGKLTRSSQARILRNNEKVHEGKVSSLRRGKDDVREVSSGYECGIVLEDFTAFEVGDIIEAFSQERVTTGA